LRWFQRVMTAWTACGTCHNAVQVNEEKLNLDKSGQTSFLATKMRTDFDNFFLRLAANNRFLWLSLTDWIDNGDQVDRIDMFGLQAMWAGRMPVLWANGT
jgi:hypothetical protein